MMTLKELRALLDQGKTITIRKDENGYAITDVADQVTCKEESIALDTLIKSLFEFGNILFDPDGLNGPSLIINNELGTEISLTEERAEILRNVGVPCFADAEKAPSFDDLLNATTDNARLLMEEIRDACEEDNFMEIFRQLAPLINKDGEKRR